MTGYGRAEHAIDGLLIRVELRSVNHRFLDLNIRLPRGWASLEPAVSSALRDRLGRGRVDVTVRREAVGASPVRPHVDLDLARRLRAAATDAAHALKVEDSLSIEWVLAQPGVLTLAEEPVDADAEAHGLDRALAEAADALEAMREAEGGRLAQDLEGHLATLAELVDRAATLADGVAARIGQRISQRLAAARTDGIDPGRLAQEVALLADKAAIDEEITRLRSHIEGGRAFLALNEPMGRRLDFLVQEMLREVNTVASKSAEAPLSALAVEMKSIVEKLKEQVANVE